MARWEPDARGRLLRTAIDLFSERGYDATTTAQIAERAGLTKTTLFRLFPDKREILFQGQGVLVDVAVEAVRATPADASPVDAVGAAVAALAEEHPTDRGHGREVTRIIAASPELQERASYKRASIAAALQGALRERVGDDRLAGVLADLGTRAYYDGFDAWITAEDDLTFAEVARRELADLEVALRGVVVGRPELHDVLG